MFCVVFCVVLTPAYHAGALGLDLSFVRYIFLMEPLADASLEQQVWGVCTVVWLCACVCELGVATGVWGGGAAACTIVGQSIVGCEAVDCLCLLLTSTPHSPLRQANTRYATTCVCLPAVTSLYTHQVVSRAHRMGAVAPVHVEVMAMRHTAEEHMVMLRWVGV